MKRLLFFFTLAALAVSFGLAPTLAQTVPSEETITGFESNIVVQKDGWLDVTETITVYSLNDEIKHGIYRDFPTTYTKYGLFNWTVPFELVSVQRDGTQEPYHTEQRSNGIRVYIGSESTIVSPGFHVYTVRYRTYRQLGFFENHDELYWNVTGNGWSFPIEKASAVVSLPPTIAAEDITAEPFTGPAGSTASNAETIIENARVSFETVAPLNAYEGLTIVVTFPKGHVTPPSALDDWSSLLASNVAAVAGLVGFAVIIAYYTLVWSRYGRDPKKNAIIPQYEPPQGLSPVALEYVKRMGATGNKSLTAHIIILAQKGLLSIEETKKKYTLKKISTATATQLERTMVEAIFKETDGSIELTQKNYRNFQAATALLHNSLTPLRKRYFTYNHRQGCLGLLLSLAVIVCMFVTLNQFSLAIILVIALIVVSNIFWLILLRAWTPEGRRLREDIEGFKWFLSVTEKDRMNFHNPPERTPELFEEFLPYALVLGVEHQWAEQFSDVFARLEQQGTPYLPSWYHGSSFSAAHPASFAGALGSSFSHSIASASSPPGSSSGSGGGGSSGGGGGGGGGGGW